MGLPGAGKSRLARALCRARGWTRVDRDAIRASLFPDGDAGPAEKAAANAALWRAVGALLRRRRSVVVDGMTFARVADRTRGRRLARRCGARCVEVWVDCPLPLAQARVRASRGHAAPDRTPCLVAEVAARFAPLARGVLRLDARQATRRQLRVLLGARVQPPPAANPSGSARDPAPPKRPPPATARAGAR